MRALPTLVKSKTNIGFIVLSLRSEISGFIDMDICYNDLSEVIWDRLRIDAIGDTHPISHLPIHGDDNK